MRKLLVLVILGVLVIPLVSPGTVWAMTGNGVEGDPYIIYNLNDLQAMANGSPYAADAWYELNNDIDASATTTWNWNPDRGVYEGFAPRVFTGHFDGKFYIISGLYIDRWSETSGKSVGLFGIVTGATIKDVRVLDADISVVTTGTLYPCGAGVLMGQITSGTTIQQVLVSGVVSATCTDTGGVGHASVSAGGLSGSVVGADLLMEKCATYVDVEAIALQTATARAGGLIGGYSSSGGMIRNCYARGSVSASEEGYTAHSAGLVGRHWGSAGSIDKCYSTGAVTTTDEGGGLVAGQDYATTSSFWDKETSGWLVSEGGYGRTTAQMKTVSTYTDYDWDFNTIWDRSSATNNGYPYLRWATYSWEEFGDQVLWFEPNTIIQGTTLPDRAGTEDGVITWGANPAGIAVSMGPLVSDDQPIPPPEPGQIVPPPDVTGPSAQPGWIDGCAELPAHPFYPIVSLISTQMNIPLCLVWIILATLILLLIMVVSYRYAPHQIITALAGGSWAGFCYSMGIYPFWVMFIFGVMAVAVVIGERSPTIS